MSDKLNLDFVIAGLVCFGIIAALLLIFNGYDVPTWLSASVIGGGFAALLRAAS